MHKAQELPGGWEKWLPPAPYDDMVRYLLRHARATLIWEDPAQPPLVAWEDGGVIAMPLIRYDDVHNFYSADDPAVATVSSRRVTRYSDVCSSIDRIKRIWADCDSLTPAEWEEINGLLEDALYMIRRLARRHEEYDACVVRLTDAVGRLAEVDTPTTPPAESGAEDLRALVEASEGHLSQAREELDALAEQVRDVAQRQEDRARDKKELWVRIATLYHEVRGPRDWEEEEVRVAGEAGE